jgi:hypothetical protein
VAKACCAAAGLERNSRTAARNSAESSPYDIITLISCVAWSEDAGDDEAEGAEAEEEEGAGAEEPRPARRPSPPPPAPAEEGAGADMLGKGWTDCR